MELAASTRRLAIVSSYSAEEWAMVDSIGDEKHWSHTEVAHVTCDASGSSDRKASTRKDFLAAIGALASGPTCIVLVPRHGHLDTGVKTRLQLDDTVDSAGILAAPIVAAALLVAQRVHLHTCWLGSTLVGLVAELSSNKAFVRRLVDRGIAEFTLSGFETPIERDPTEGDRHGAYVRHGCLNVWSRRHDTCCQRRGVVRVVHVHVATGLIITRNQVLGGCAKTDRHGEERAEASSHRVSPGAEHPKGQGVRAGAGRSHM